MNFSSHKRAKDDTKSPRAIAPLIDNTPASEEIRVAGVNCE